MTVLIANDGAIELRGHCPSEDAEILLQSLLATPGVVDVQGCESMHTAVVQVLLACKPGVRGSLPPGFLREHLQPLLLTSLTR